MAETHRVTATQRKKWKIVGSESRASPSAPSEADTRLAVPFRGHITGGLQPGKKVLLVGVVDPHPDRFYVALSCGPGSSRQPPEDVALEVCVRFKEQQVLRRACLSGSWGEADRNLPFFPFIKDQPFKMELHCEYSRFRVFVDGQQLFYFQHRLAPLERIDTLWVKGSLAITKLA